MHKLSCAHKSLPLGSVIRVLNLRNGKSITLKVTDRGPYIKGRIVDLSYAAARVVGMVGVGIVPCMIEIVSTEVEYANFNARRVPSLSKETERVFQGTEWPPYLRGYGCMREMRGSLYSQVPNQACSK